MFEIWAHFFPYQKPIWKRVRHRGWRLLVKMCVMRKNLQYVNNWCNRSADDVCKNYFKIVDFKLTVRSPCNLRQLCPEKYHYVSNINWDIFNIQKLLQMKDWIKLLQFMRELLWQSKIIGQNHLFKTAKGGRKSARSIYSTVDLQPLWRQEILKN